jgi:hypothetical protein
MKWRTAAATVTSKVSATTATVMLHSDLLRRGLQNLLVARAHGEAATPLRRTLPPWHGQSLDSRLRPARLDLSVQDP